MGRAARATGALSALTSAALLPLAALALLGAPAAPPGVPGGGQDGTRVEERAGAGSSGTPSPSGVAGEEDGSARSEPAPASPSPVPVVEQGTGDLVVVPGSGARSGPGPVQRLRVEVEDGLGLDAGAFARAVETVLSDPRSWGSSDRRSFQRTDGDADVVVVLASPATTDRLCAPLRTNGRFSCANGARAVINSMRWLRGADAYAGDLTGYRQYVVNHEVGHVLGQGHVGCPAPGAAAPVMVQQTIGLQGCRKNPWPYP